MRRTFLLSLLALALSCGAWGQGSVSTGPPTAVNGQGQPLPGVKVAVCTANPGLTPVPPCTSTLAVTYTDITLSTQCVGTAKPLSNPGGAGSTCSNPGFVDSKGNVLAYAVAGTYWCEYYGTNVHTYVEPCIFPGTGGGGGGGSVGPGTVNNLAKFTSVTNVGNATCTDDGVTPMACGLGVSLAANALFTAKPNNGIVGTTANLLVAHYGAGAIAAQPTDTNNIIGVAGFGAGTTGSVSIAYSGQFPCIFDNQTAIGDWVTLGATSQCHDAGATQPSGIETIGQINSVNAGPGTLAGVDLGLPSVTNTSTGGGTGIVSPSATPGPLPYYQIPGNTVVPDAAITSDGAGGLAAKSLSLSGTPGGSLDLFGSSSGDCLLTVDATATTFQSPCNFTIDLKKLFLTNTGATPSTSSLSVSVANDGRGTIQFGGSGTSAMLFDVDGGLVFNPATASVNKISINNAGVDFFGSNASFESGSISCAAGPHGLCSAIFHQPIFLAGNTSGGTILYAQDVAGSHAIGLPAADGTAALTSNFSTALPIGNVVPNTGAFTTISVNATGIPAQVNLTPSGTSPATVAGAASIGVPNTVTTPGVYLLPAAPGTGVYFGTNSAGIVTHTFKTQQGTGSAILSSGTVSGLAATLCTDATGAATTTGCGSGGGAIGGLTSPKIPVANSGTTLIDSSLTDTGSLLSTTDTMSVAGNGAASAPGHTWTGTLFSGGSGTTTFPYLYYNCTGSTQPTDLSTNGSVFGANTCTGFAGNYLDFHNNGAASVFKVTSAGAITTTNGVTIGATNGYTWVSSSRILAPSDGILRLSNTATTGFTRLDFGGITSSFAAIGSSGTTLTSQLADGTGGGLFVQSLGGKWGCTHGSNGTCGVSTLSGGTVTVSTTAIAALAAAGAAGDVVALTLQSCSSCGTLSVGTVVAATSFVINSTNGADASDVYWEIKHVN